MTNEAKGKNNKARVKNFPKKNLVGAGNSHTNARSKIVITGKVIKGLQYGKQLGFPTANLDRRQFVKLINKPKLGIYAGIAEIMGNKNNKIYKAGIVIGPLDKTGLPKIEAHLIGFTGSLYGRNLSLQLFKYLRAFRKFKNTKQLVSEIVKDIKKVQLISFK